MLSPIVPEFEIEEQEASYDQWFRAKVDRCGNTGPATVEPGLGRHGQRWRLAVVQVRASPQDVPFWTRRMVEWSIVVGVILLLVLVFARQARVLQGQAELSAVKTTLGALRTAFVLDHLHNSVVVRTSSVVLAQHNPFELLQRHPVNYLGEMTDAAAQTLPPGSWVFDPVCACVGYQPIYAQWFDSPSGDVMIWYEVSGELS